MIPLRFYPGLFIWVGWLFLTSSCGEETPAMEYYLEEGVFKEKLAPEDRRENRFTEDNQLYIPGKEFIFDYYYSTKDDVRYKFWKEAQGLVSPSAADSTTIIRLGFEPRPGLDAYRDTPGFDQSVMQINYYTADGRTALREQNGFVENQQNIMLTPPRIRRLFRMLALNPYPFIQQPYEPGTTFRWKRAISNVYGDPFWYDLQETLYNEYSYEIVRREKLNTPLGQLPCLVVEATASNDIQRPTFLTSYFNESYGFVKLEFTNIDSTKLVMELESVRDRRIQ
jgi:hypothetical protein